LAFVFAAKANAYRVIELNPRFWMQHGLTEAITGMGLVRAYLHLPQASGDTAVRYWVNPLYALFRMLKGDMRGLRFARSEAYLPFSFLQALGFSVQHCWNRLNGKR